jgi:hypothetical protein
MNGTIQSALPGRQHYTTKYLRDGRIFSYAHQIDAVLSFEPESVVEIGKGAGMVSAALRSVGVQVTSVDLQFELHPDIVASVTDLPFREGLFEVALCCQVLEHLPFDLFVPALKQLRKSVSKGLVASLPDVSRNHYIAFQLPKTGERRYEWTFPRLRDPEFPRQARGRDGHYWEIGYKGYSLSRVIRVIAHGGWKVDRTWCVPEKRWHRFFLCTPA